MAPEQARGDSTDARADVFAFGVVIYEYACGAHPFEGSTPLATIARVLESDARPIATRCPDLSPGLAEIIGRCLRKAPAERYASASEIVAALDAGNHERAFELLLEEAAGGDADHRERMRELAVALFGELGGEHLLTLRYRRRLATVLY
jgi:serine/threonine protein kinase